MREYGYVSLNEIVDRTLFQMGETGTHKKFMALTHAQDIWRELVMDVMRQYQTVELEVDSLRTVYYPEDYINYVMIGICLPKAGIIASLGRNDRMCPILTNDCGNSVAVTGGDVRGVVPSPEESGDYYAWYFNNNHEGRAMGKQFGYGGGYSSSGYYYNDTENRRFQFSSDMKATSIILRYISDGVSCTGNTMVHVFAEATIRTYIRWQMEAGKNSKINIAATWQRHHLLEKAKLRMRKLSTITELIASYRRGQKLVAKQ